MAKKDECKDWAEFPVLRDMDFGELAERRAEIKDTIDALEEEKKEIDEKLRVALIVSEQKGVLYDKYVVDMRSGSSAAKVSAKMLVEKGVSADVIKQCTVPGSKYEYIMFTDTTPKADKEAGSATTETENG